MLSAALGWRGSCKPTPWPRTSPAYKTMGAGWSYALLGSIVLALMGYFGWFAHFFESVPGAALFPLIVYIGLRTIAHSLEVTPPRHYAAMALATVPVLAYLVVVAIDEIFVGRAPSPGGDVLLRALRCLGNGFILTSLLWAAALCAILDGSTRRAAVCLAVAAVFSLVGLVHSPSPGAPLAWPHEVWKQLIANANPRVQFLSPFHWAAGYALAAGVCFHRLLLFRRSNQTAKPPEKLTYSGVSYSPCACMKISLRREFTDCAARGDGADTWRQSFITLSG